MDQELKAMEACAEALRPLDDAACVRVLAWLNSRFAPPTTTPRLREALEGPDFKRPRTAQAKYLWIVEFLCRQHPSRALEAAEGVKGDSRVYFAKDPETIQAAGSGAKAMQIPGYPLWADVNNSTEAKRRILGQLMTSLDYSTEDIALAQEAI